MDQPAFGIYLHVPFCVTRCGYCDFNTYTASELSGSGASATGFLDAAAAEIEQAVTVVGERVVDTVFVGGGTPTLLAPEALVRLLERIRGGFGLRDDAEVTTEANPDSVTPQGLRALAEGGFTRVSFGMQSSVPHVLATLDRTHDPRRIPEVVRWARDAGLQVSLDLIYGTPGESDEDWAASVRAALACEPDHVSAYALGIEPGTRMGRQVRRGELRPVDPDEQARRYEAADDLLGGAGLAWYEISNWSTAEATRCEHNLGYWRDGDWWGIGPGAHSHLGRRRWWNVKHPARYASMLGRGEAPVEGAEDLDEAARDLERIMLGIRLREGLAVRGLAGVAGVVADGLGQVEGDRLVLTRRGRLLADAVTRRLVGWE